MKSYRARSFTKTSFKINESLEGESIEQKMQRIINNKEPIKDGAPLIYTERKEGVLAGYNIRTDRFEVALDAIDKVEASKTAKRESVAKLDIVKDEAKDNNSEAEPIQTTNQ